MSKIVSGKIIERGNGFPSLKDRVYDSVNDKVYEVLSLGRIQTGPAGNWVVAQLHDLGLSAGDLDEEEWNEIGACGGCSVRITE